MMASKQDICRTCLENDNNLIEFTKQNLVCGELLSVADILSIYSSINIQMDETDTFPKYVCHACVQEANSAYSFIKRCERSDLYLKSQLEIQTTTETKDENCQPLKLEQNTPIEFCPEPELENSASSSDSKPIHCEICTKNFTSASHLEDHTCSPPTNTLRSMRRSTRVQKQTPIDDNNDTTESENEVEDTGDDIQQYEDDDVSKPDELWYQILKNSTEKNEQGLYCCICCSEQYDDLKLLRDHTRTHTRFKCKLCKKSFTLLTNLRRHLRTHSDNSAKYESYLLQKLFQYKCISCTATFARRKQLSEHLKTHKEFTCTLCTAKFTFITNLRKHIRWHNRPKDEIPVFNQPPVEKRTCDLCFKVFKYRPSMLKHRKKHDAAGKRCKYCDLVCDTSILLYKHMEELHSEQKHIVCTQCGKRFFKEWNLKMHMMVHTGVKPFMCEICGASFALGGNLASHKRLHTGIKPYVCSTCGRGFTQQSALRSHEASHSERRDFVCPDCGSAFTRAGAMRNHRKRHEKSRPFPCSMCDKRFTFSSERKRHMTIHTGEKNYVCDVCGKAFNRPTNLTVHQRIHTGELPYKCTVCGKGFIQVHSLNTHLNTHQ